ncbi:Opsin-VA [Liparis tanakae]|uniref:Opsin-VA n=1 Tax=Liparis tanakae TaxID=230148 RepID=A0A4Z2F2M3_9TELE|nr:Opsin-VA [Liparis tanakae]
MTDHSYIITFFATCFILPLGVIFFCYGKLLRKLKQVSHGRLATARKPERQVTRMVVVMIVAFMKTFPSTAPLVLGVERFSDSSAKQFPHPEIDPTVLSGTPAPRGADCSQIARRLYSRRKCLIQLFGGLGTIPDSHLNATSERPGITQESQTGEMSVIGTRGNKGDGAMPPRFDDSPTDCGSLAQLPIPENKVCPI